MLSQNHLPRDVSAGNYIMTSQTHDILSQQPISSAQELSTMKSVSDSNHVEMSQSELVNYAKKYKKIKLKAKQLMREKRVMI